ncbi:MAG: class I SAM-dependent methyltransferase [Ignavibacterium sp.]|nr:MAG: class I SAM-dependent methyltransferase [Ignavibacterium sp.]
MSLLDNVRMINDVYFLSDVDNTFEKLYVEVRKRENRIYSDHEVSQLPSVPPYNLHYKEWVLRKITSDRFIRYLKQKRNGLILLDVGCGNGWFTSLIAKSNTSEVYGIDVNKLEIEQAARVFNLQNLHFVYGNLFDDIFPKKSFDMITLNASAQYFKDLNYLLNKLLSLMTDDGEIHILDTPFYRSEELASARERTAAYYKSLGHLEMAKYYFHHSYEEIEKFNYSILFNPRALKVKLKKFLNVKDSPFPWIKILK